MPIECAELAERIENILDKLGTEFSLKRFFDGRELLKCVESSDIVFPDIKMPEINGMELAGQMRENGRGSIIVFVTSAREYVYEAYDVEAFHFLLKPAGRTRQSASRLLTKPKSPISKTSPPKPPTRKPMTALRSATAAKLRSPNRYCPARPISSFWTLPPRSIQAARSRSRLTGRSPLQWTSRLDKSPTHRGTFPSRQTPSVLPAFIAQFRKIILFP